MKQARFPKGKIHHFQDDFLRFVQEGEVCSVEVYMMKEEKKLKGR